jgi:hypothetical protein
MKFNTAVGMFLCGISVIFLSYEPISTPRRFVVFLISFIVGLGYNKSNCALMGHSWVFLN